MKRQAVTNWLMAAITQDPEVQKSLKALQAKQSKKRESKDLKKKSR